MNRKSVVLRIRIDPDTLAQLRGYAEQHSLSPSEVARQAIMSYICPTPEPRRTFVGHSNTEQREPAKNAKLEFARSLMASLQTKPKLEPDESLVKPIPVKSRPSEDDWNAIDSA